MSEKPFFSVAEFAPLVHLHKITAYRFISEGKIKAARIGGRIIIPASELTRIAQSAALPEARTAQ